MARGGPAAARGQVARAGSRAAGRRAWKPRGPGRRAPSARAARGQVSRAGSQAAGPTGGGPLLSGGAPREAAVTRPLRQAPGPGWPSHRALGYRPSTYVQGPLGPGRSKSEGGWELEKLGVKNRRNIPGNRNPPSTRAGPSPRPAQLARRALGGCPVRGARARGLVAKRRPDRDGEVQNRKLLKRPCPPLVRGDGVAMYGSAAICAIPLQKASRQKAVGGLDICGQPGPPAHLARYVRGRKKQTV